MIKVLIFFASVKYFKYLKFQDTPKLHTTLTGPLKFTVVCNNFVESSHYLLSVTICVVCGIIKKQ